MRTIKIEAPPPVMTHHCGGCTHQPVCPSAAAADREAARIVALHPEQGWSLLCNGLVQFDDTGVILPDGRAVGPHRPTDSPSRG